MPRRSILFLFFVGSSRLLFATAEADLFQGNRYIVRENVKVKVRTLQQSIFFITAEVAISTPYMELKSPEGQKIEELEGITYSFVNAFVIIGSAATISFDLSNEASEKHEITQLEFLTPDDGNFIYYLNDMATGKQNSEKEGCKDAYSFGVLRTPTLAKTVAGYYKNPDWYYIIARITVRNKKEDSERKYKIRINPKVYNEFQKELRKVYENQDFSHFPIPVE
ncbi:hypothetical protein LKV13_00775 [Borrelia sp. BU AG58]|uniref:BB0158 famile outer surface lipoprotein n=1 Tax=Borrelia sp. BU AG58 TaxID=2887345 RepID=UPI001E3AD2CE|nr:hypothetical protein [Borrelia sp. BU AG58]UER67358.1 hypothetical protein LKV13_00775 [Borrelia sp. BU AG58]